MGLCPGRNDLQPVAVGILDEVDPHGRVFKADAAHLLVQRVSRGEVVDAKSQVELLLPDVVGLRVIPQPGQLELEFRGVVGYVDDDELPVGVLLAANLAQTQRLFVKRQGDGQIADVVVFVDQRNWIWSWKRTGS